MHRRLLALSGGLLGAAALMLIPVTAARANENLGVPIITQAQGSGYTDIGEVDEGEAYLTALYVDSSGAAHVAYVEPNDQDVGLCTIPAGAGACSSTTTLHTDADANAGDGEVESLKYLPDGNGAAILAVGLSDLGHTLGENPPFDTWETAPWTETEVFQPGATTGTAIGTVYDAGSTVGGDEIYVPDQSGLEIVGQYSDYDWPPPGVYGPANAYEFESFTSPSSADTMPQFLGVHANTAQTGDLPADELLPGEWPAGITELANGATAVLSYYLDETAPASTDPGLAPVGMYVQPAGGGAFSSLRDLGINGPVTTDFAPGAETYLIDGVSTDPSGGINTNPPENLELYEFDGQSLQALGTIGSTDDNLSGNIFPEESEWDTMPPTFEDTDGNLYAAWYASGGDDACPASSSNDASAVSDCLMYREIGAGGVFGPKVVLSEAYGDSSVDEIGDVDQIAANTAGDGWVLDWREPGSSSTYTLYAEPLGAAATVPSPASVDGTVTSVPLTCSGTGNCSLTVTLDTAAAQPALRTSHRGHAASSGLVVAHATVTLRAGAHRRLTVGLDRAGRALLHRSHARLPARLQVVQTLGMTKAHRTVYSRWVTLR